MEENCPSPKKIYSDWSDSDSEDVVPEWWMSSTDPLDLKICARGDEDGRVVRSVVIATPAYQPITEEDREIERRCNEMIAGTGLSPLRESEDELLNE